MKYFIFIIPLLFTAHYCLADNTELTFKFTNNSVVFVHLKDKKLTISKNCLSSGTFSCEAYKALSQVSFNKAMPLSKGGTHPGSVICRSQAGGQVVIGTQGQSENSFCHFKDGSLVDNGSLVHYARQNDKTN